MGFESLGMGASDMNFSEWVGRLGFCEGIGGFVGCLSGFGGRCAILMRVEVGWDFVEEGDAQPCEE